MYIVIVMSNAHWLKTLSPWSEVNVAELWVSRQQHHGRCFLQLPSLGGSVTHSRMAFLMEEEERNKPETIMYGTNWQHGVMQRIMDVNKLWMTEGGAKSAAQK
jgi:hypothetical protein